MNCWITGRSTPVAEERTVILAPVLLATWMRRSAMSVESTSQVMNDYLDALLKQEDFARYFADDIVWTTTETGDEVRGRDAVRDFIVVFHNQAFKAHA
jgi:hypothetical protein